MKVIDKNYTYYVSTSEIGLECDVFKAGFYIHRSQKDNDAPNYSFEIRDNGSLRPSATIRLSEDSVRSFYRSLKSKEKEWKLSKTDWSDIESWSQKDKLGTVECTLFSWCNSESFRISSTIADCGLSLEREELSALLNLLLRNKERWGI